MSINSSKKDDEARDANPAWGAALGALGEMQVKIKDNYLRMQQLIPYLINIAFLSSYSYTARTTLAQMADSAGIFFKRI